MMHASAPQRDESGQMLLLTAIILAIGFIALASLAARIDQIPEDAEQVQSGLFFDEVNLVADAVITAMDGTVEDWESTDLGSAAFSSELDDRLAYMVHVERGHGYLVSLGTVSCSSSGGDVDLQLAVAMASADQEITVTITETYTAASC